LPWCPFHPFLSTPFLQVQTLERELRKAAVAFTEHARDELFADDDNDNMDYDEMTGMYEDVVGE
jgi:hypothetical protein